MLHACVNIYIYICVRVCVQIKIHFGVLPPSNTGPFFLSKKIPTKLHLPLLLATSQDSFIPKQFEMSDDIPIESPPTINYSVSNFHRFAMMKRNIFNL